MRALLPLIGGMLLLPDVGAPQDEQGPGQKLFDEGLAALQAGRLEEGIALYERCLELRPEDRTCAYNIACGHSLLGQADEAFRWLGQAVDWGWGDYYHLQADSDLVPLHSDPRWEALLDRLLERIRSLHRARRAELTRAREDFEQTLLVWQDGHSRWIQGARFNPDGRGDIVTWGDDGRVVVWDSETGEARGFLGLHSTGNYSTLQTGNSTLQVEYSRSGRRALVFDAHVRQLSLWNPRTGSSYPLRGLEDEIVIHFDLSPDGRAFVVGELQGRVRAFDFDGRELESPRFRTATPSWIRWGADGSRILTHADDWMWRLFDAATGELLQTFPGDPGAVPAQYKFVHFTDDGQRLIVHTMGAWLAGGFGDRASFAQPCRVQVWGALEPSEPLFERDTLLPPTRDLANGRCFDARGTRLVTLEDVQDERRFRVWDVDTGSVLGELPTPSLLVARATMRADGKRVATSVWDPDARQVSVFSSFDAQTGEVLSLRRAAAERTGPVAFSPDGKMEVHQVGEVLGAFLVQAADGLEGSESALPWGFDHGGTISGFHFSPDGERLVSVGYPSFGTVHRLTEERDPSPSILASHSMRAHDVCIGPPSSEGGPPTILCTAAGNDNGSGAVRVWDPAQGSAARSLRKASRPLWGCRLQPDGERVVAFGIGGFWLHGLDGTEQGGIPAPAAVIHAEFGLDGSRILATPSGQTPSVALFGAGDREGSWKRIGIYPSWKWGSNVNNPAAVFGQGGNVFALVSRPEIGDSRATVEIRDGETGELIESLPAGGRPVKHLAFSPDGRWLLTCSSVTSLWDAVSFERIPGGSARFGGIVWHASFSSDSSRYAAASLDHTGGILWVDGSRPGIRLEGHTDEVVFAAFGPGDTTLVTCSRDRTARLWDGNTGEAGPVLRGHADGVRSAAFVGEDRLVTVGDDATFRMWEVPSPKSPGWDQPEGGRLLATLVIYEDDNWLVFEPGGYYDGTPQAAEWARIRTRPGAPLVPLSCYAATLHDRDMVELSIGGETVPPAPTLEPAPFLNVESPTASEQNERRFELRVEAEGLEEVRRFHVKQDDGAWRVLEEQELGEPEPTRRGWSTILTMDLAVPEPRAETTILVRAEDVGRVLSPTETVHVRYAPPSGRLFLLAIGVQDYEDDDYDLQYPEQDVEDIVARFQAEAGGLYEEVLVETLIGEQVDAGALTALTDEFLYQARAEDTIIVFVAGHGARSRTGRYFFLPPGVSPRDPVRGIPRQALYDLVQWEGIQATKRLLLIDTCHAGEDLDGGKRGVGVGDAFEQDRVDEELQGSGLYIVTASSELGFAQELEGNGVFTSALLAGLDGAADREGNDNGTADIRELLHYVQAEVQRRTAGEQRPTVPRSQGGVPFHVARVPR